MVFVVTLNTMSALGQFFIAGQYNASNYFHDVNPDTTMYGPWDHQPPFHPPAKFEIDINGDGINDFYLYSYGSYSLASSQAKTKICVHNNCQIAFGYYDTCFSSMPSQPNVVSRMAKSFKKYDTINDQLVWSNSDLWLAGLNYMMSIYDCDFNGFINDTLGNYIGVRIFHSNDTLYGWIKVTNIDVLKVTIQEFACSENSVNIEEKLDDPQIFPNPVVDKLIINTHFSNYDLVIYDQYGREQIEKKHLSGITNLYISWLIHGIYILKIADGNSVVVKKIIKE